MVACHFATIRGDWPPEANRMSVGGPQGAGADGPDAQPPPVADGALRVDSIRGIPAALRSLGIDPGAFVLELGLDSRIFDDPVNEIPIVALGRLFRLAVARTGCPHFGLLVGGFSGLASLGLVGLLAQHSPDVGTALRNLSTHFHLRNRGAVAPLRVSGGSATLGYEIYQSGVEAIDQLCDAAIAIAMNAMRALCGRGWRPTAVLFSHASPADARPFRSFFGVPLRFDSERTALVFPARWLAHRPAAADPELYQVFERRIEAIELRAGSDLVGDLRRMLRTLLVDGGGSVEEVAQRLALHRRTLNRRLQALGTSLHQIVEEIRFEIARQLVEHTQMPLVEVASALGYADASAFTRAFRRWSGRAPSAWREDPHPEAVARTVKPGASAGAYTAPALARGASLGGRDEVFDIGPRTRARRTRTRVAAGPRDGAGLREHRRHDDEPIRRSPAAPRADPDLSLRHLARGGAARLEPDGKSLFERQGWIAPQ